MAAVFCVINPTTSILYFMQKELTDDFQISFLLVQKNVLHFEIPDVDRRQSTTNNYKVSNLTHEQ